MTFDEVLSWNKHVNSCISKAMCHFRQLSNYKHFLDSEAKKNFCETMVLSQFNYCDMVYLNINKQLENKIQKIQNICIRYIFNCKRREHVDFDMLRKKLGWLKMTDRRVSHGLTQMHKIVHGSAPNYLKDLITLTSELNMPQTRSQTRNTIYIPNEFRTEIRRKAFLFSMSSLYNTIPEEITKSITVNTFKGKIKKHFMQK